MNSKGTTSAAAEAFCSSADVSNRRTALTEIGLHSRAGRRKYQASSSSMHFSFYLMIAALVLVGFELAYALYQLTLFVL